MVAENTAKIQRGTPFPKGQSGNPNGKPKGSRNKTTLAIEALFNGEAEALTRKVIEKALEGDMTALRLCLDRIAPAKKDAPVAFSMPPIQRADDAAKAMAGILRALADGDITPNEASSVAGVIETYRKTLETAEFEKRLQSLEQVTQNAKS